MTTTTVTIEIDLPGYAAEADRKPIEQGAEQRLREWFGDHYLPPSAFRWQWPKK